MFKLILALTVFTSLSAVAQETPDCKLNINSRNYKSKYSVKSRQKSLASDCRLSEEPRCILNTTYLVNPVGLENFEYEITIKVGDLAMKNYSSRIDITPKDDPRGTPSTFSFTKDLQARFPGTNGVDWSGNLVGKYEINVNCN